MSEKIIDFFAAQAATATLEQGSGAQTPDLSELRRVNAALTKAPSLSTIDIYNADGKHWHDLLKDFSITLDASHKEIRERIAKVYKVKEGILNRTIKVFNEYGVLTDNISLLVRVMLDKTGFHVSWNGQHVTNGKLEMANNRIATIKSYDDLCREIWLRLIELEFNPNRDVVYSTIDSALNDRKDSAYADIQQEILFNGNPCKEEWSYIAREYFDLENSSESIVIATLQKFIHSVKVKMAGGIVDNHTMPVIMGLTQAGKSYFIEHILCRPMKDFKIQSNFAQATDERNAFQWQVPIHIFDEMSNAAKSDVERIKQIITNSSQTYRPMRSNNVQTVRNSSTFIGTSNKMNLSDLIKDTTSNRRFVPLFFRNSMNKKPLPFDPIILWQSVDVKVDPFNDDILKEVKVVQSGHRFRNYIDEFFNDFIEENPLKQNQSITIDKDFHRAYLTWCGEQGKNFRIGSTEFKNDIRDYVESLPDYSVKNQSNRLKIVKVASDTEGDIFQ